MTEKQAIREYALRLGDDSLILGHRISEWCAHGPILEEDIALTNIALDLIGQATSFLEYASDLDEDNKSADDLAFLRYERDYRNVLLVEQPNGDFGQTIVRSFLFDVYHKLFFEQLTKSADTQIAAIAEKSLKEVIYHLRHSSEWMIRLGDGTEESHNRVQDSLNKLWAYRTELFYMDDVDAQLIEKGIAVDLSLLQADYDKQVLAVLNEATLSIPENTWKKEGGRKGLHTEHLGFLLAEMQYMQRAYPGMEW